MNRAPLVPHLKERRLEPHPLALLADKLDVGEELHLFNLHAVPFASLATTARHVEAEMRRVVTVRLRLARGGEEVAYAVVHFYIGDRVRARRAPDGRLIDEHHVFDELPAVEFRERTHMPGPLAALFLQPGVDDVVDER